MSKKFEFEGMIGQDPKGGFEILLNYEQVIGKEWRPLGAVLTGHFKSTTYDKPDGDLIVFPGKFKVTIEKLDEESC